MRIHLSLLLAALLGLGCKTSSAVAPEPTQAAAAPAAEPIRLTIVGTNDLHGWVYPHQTPIAGGKVLRQGGVAAFAGYLEILRADNPGGVLLLDGGDLFQGTLAANLTEGSVVIEAMNRLGYHAAALGNHEFDYGPVGPVSVVSSPDQDPFGALKARLKQASFPLLAVNVYEARSGERPKWLGNDGTAMFTLKGVKVGVFGLITPSTPTTTNPVNVTSLRFGSLAPETVAAAKELRAKGAEVVIAVAHAGGKCAKWDKPEDLSTCDKEAGEIFEALSEVPPGLVDAVIAGHTHQVMGHIVNGTPVIETAGLGRQFGVIELFVDPARRRVAREKTIIRAALPICTQLDRATQSCDPKLLDGKPVELLPATFMGKPVVLATALEQAIAPALAQVEVEQRRSLGLQNPKRLGRNYEAESALGSFLADALREMEQVDVALLNSGGLRADLPAGAITYGDVYEVLPFDNSIATLHVTGEELRRLLQAAYGARKGVFQVSGLRVTLGRCPGKNRLKSFSLADGKPVDAQKWYRVVMPDFLARGGDGLGPVLAALKPEQVDLGTRRPLNLRDALVAHWQKKKAELAPPTLGRILFADEKGPCLSSPAHGP